MQRITLPNNKVALLDDDDYEKLSCYKWQCNKNGYAWRMDRSSGKQKYTLMHHEIFGKPPVGLVTDHIDRNKLNNQKSNLRFCTQSENSKNVDREVANSEIGSHSWQKYPNKSGFKGITRDRNKWVSQIWVNYKRYVIGRYETPEDAAIAYDNYVIENFGTNAFLNFPERLNHA